MSDTTSFQISGNIGNAYCILKGESVAAVEQQSVELAAAFDRIATNLVAVQQIALIKEAFSSKDFKGGSGGGAAPAASGGGAKASGSFNRPAGGGGGGAQQGSGQTVQIGPDGKGTCGHGVKLLDYVKKDGRRCHGWYCQERDRAKQCKALTLDGHGQ